MTIDFSFSDYGIYQPGQSNLAATGSTQADALPLKFKVCHFATVSAGTGAILPTNNASRTLEIVVINRGANVLLVYPPPGGQIEDLGVNIPAQVVALGAAIFVCFDSPMAPGMQWFTH